VTAVDDLASAGVPALDSRVDEIALDASRSFEERIEELAEYVLLTKNEADELNARSWIECLTMRRLASDRVD
jgi:hypothetical protein